jgi:type IV secretion system protein VirB9
MKKLFQVVFFTLLAISSNAYAVQESIPIANDNRIRVVPYNPNDVFKFVGHFGFQSSIEFAPEETIKTISIGDSMAWQVVPEGNRLFLKPIEENPQTNMTVVTNRRVYQFELQGKHSSGVRDSDMIFVMRFTYPGDTDVTFVGKNTAPDISTSPGKYNQAYKISGPERISPIRIFDDGEFTYFQFRDINADIPGFFLVDSEGKEAIINFRTVGAYIVVERVAPRFTLRHGIDVVCVFNDNMPYVKAETK